MEQKKPKRILVIRLDRIGDVVLSTPVLSALRRAYPDAFISVMVRSVCGDLVRNHSAINEVILYKKEEEHRGIWATIWFALKLRTYHFDTALVLHPSNRSHWITWFAGIPRRIGYNRKSSWVLTERLKHIKQKGEKSEADYTLDMLQPLGVDTSSILPSITVQREALDRINKMLSEKGLSSSTRIVAVHPSASDQSKRWMGERFAEVADRLIEKHGVNICLVSGKADVKWAEEVAQSMRNKPIDFAGKLSLTELTALFQRSTVLLSNDSGPVHIAAALSTPVVVIFGRSEPGLSSRRWGPVGQGHIVLQKRVDEPHDCTVDFRCLSALSVDEVYEAVVSVLNR